MTSPPRHIALCVSLALLGVLSSNAQHTNELGLPYYFEHFAPHEYHGHPQNWAIAQDARGVIYVGNYSGILSYDGADWSTIKTPANTTVRSIATDVYGGVYVGLQGDFGYLAADSIGRARFESLATGLPPDFSDFRDVWGTHVAGNHVYFQTSNYLIRWNGTSHKVWKSESVFHTSFYVAGEVYVRERGTGLLKVSGNELNLVPGGDVLADSELFLLEEHPDGGLLAITKNQGFFRLTKDGAEPFSTALGAWTEKHRIYTGVAVGNNQYALGFLDGGGIVIVDSDGNWIDSFTEESGLPDGWVNDLFLDRQGGLWAALNNKGIIRFDVLSALTRFDNRSGLEGIVASIRRDQDDVYVATSIGLYLLEPTNSIGRRASFRRLPILKSATRSILPTGDGLLAATHTGVLLVKKGALPERILEGSFYAMAQSSFDSSMVYIGSETGVSIIHYNGSRWQEVGEILTLNKEVFSIIEASPQEIWLTTRVNDVFRIRFTSDWKLKSRDEFILPIQEIDGQVFVTQIDQNVFVGTKDGMLVPSVTPEEKTLRFITGGSSGETFADTLLAFTSAPNGDLWQVYPHEVDISRVSSGVLTRHTPALLGGLNWADPVQLELDEGGIAWISTGSTLIRYDQTFASWKSYEAPFAPLVRNITTIDEDRLLYGGTSFGGGVGGPSPGTESIITVLSFEQNALRFEFALPSYNDAAANEFQYLLEGKDEHWSHWTKETSKNFTNLFEGTYTFHVRGRNAQGFVSPVSTYSFTVMPPWYRSVWAYGAYFMAFVGVGLFVRRHRRIVAENKKAKAQAKELVKEREVNERLNDLNRRLQQANESLLQADRLKDEFLANTSHELRTPLTGILGCASILREEVNEEQAEFIEMIDENGQRLLRTLDSLLDLARLRAGLMELQCDTTDIGKTAFGVAQTYMSVSDKKAVDLDVRIDGDVTAWVDEHCLECVLNHLVGNAVKFTDDGQVEISVARDENTITLSVADTGIGIDEEFLPFLFDEFKQESTGLTRSHEGNGLGLAVTSRLVDLMGGEIEVESQKGVGTTFTIYLPVQSGSEKLTGEGLQLKEVDLQSSEPDRAAA